jgi:diguanylate cyclase (GGDEF)-like protein
METPSSQADPEARAESPRQSAAEELGLSPHRSEDALERLLRLLAHMSGAPIAALCIDDQGRQFVAAAQGIDEAHRALPCPSALIEQALHRDDFYAVGDTAQDPQLAADPLVTGPCRVRAFAGIAIRGLDRLRVGALCLMDSEPREFDEIARAALQDLRVLVEDRLRLRADVLHDPLTGAIARRHFDEIADREWRRAMRALTPISVIVCELDRIDEFAEREGRTALDRGLRAAALAMQYSMHRPGDCVSRYDETRFALLLPGTEEAGAVETAERVRRAVEALLIPFADAPTSMLTLSAGVATIHSEALSRGDLPAAVHAATVALRNAQAAGGNRWTLAGAHGELLLGAR